MKKVLIIMAALTVSTAVFAADVKVSKAVLGSGTPVFNTKGAENTKIVDNAQIENGILHAPQYMPYHPTAATIWPRVVEVPCTENAEGDLTCAGYNWSPAMGRGEYLFVAPKVVKEPSPIVVVVPGPEVLVEVPVKKKGE